MSAKHSITAKCAFGMGLALALTLVTWWTVAARAADDNQDGHHEGHVAHLNHITTQAEAEALKPGDMIAMACSTCKHVMVQPVTNDGSHVKLMTIGEEHMCVCGGMVTVVGTGQGNGKNEAVNHVCSKCGDSAMFVCATNPGSGHQHDHEAGNE